MTRVVKFSKAVELAQGKKKLMKHADTQEVAGFSLDTIFLKIFEVAVEKNNNFRKKCLKK